MSVPTAAWTRLTTVEAKLLQRNPAGIIIPVGLPLLLLVMSGIGADDSPVAELGGMSEFAAITVPVTLVMIIGLIGLVNLPGFLADHRSSGWLRRLSVTPAHPAMLLVAQTVVSLTLTVVGLAIALGVAATAFDVPAPINLGGALVAFGLGVAAMFALGLVIAAIAPSQHAADGIGLVGFAAMFVLLGGFGGLEAFPDWLVTIGEYSPMGATAGALSDAWTGATPATGPLVSLAVTAAAAATAAAKLFRWE